MQIDYWSVLMLAPVLILGLTLGQLFNIMVASWLLNLIIICIWTYSSVQCWFVYKRTRAKEIADAEAKAAKAKEEDAKLAAAAASLEEEDGRAKTAAESDCKEGVWTRAGKSVSAWWAMQPHRWLLAIVLLFGTFLTAQVFRAIITKCASPAYWSVFTITVAFGAVAMAVLCIIAARDQRTKQQPSTSTADDAAIIKSSDSNNQPALESESRDLPTIVIASMDNEAAAANDERGNAPSPPVATTIDLTSTSVCSASSSSMTDAAASRSEEVQDRATGADKSPQPPPAAQQGDTHNDASADNQDAINWTTRTMAKVHPQVFVAGLLLGTWPISPIILTLGLHAQVTAGTSKVLLFMITGGTGITFASSGSLSLTYVLVYGLTNLIATPIGVYCVDKVIKRTGRPSIIVMLTLVRLTLCTAIQFAFALVPNLMALANGLDKAGFFSNPLCA